MTKESKEKGWMSQHADTMVLSGFILTMFGVMISLFSIMNSNISDVRKDMNIGFEKVDARLSVLEKETNTLKTIMIMNGHYPKELAKGD